MALMDVKCT